MLDSLSKIFYSSPQSHARSYEERISSPLAVTLPFEIKQFNHSKSYTAFFYYHQDVVSRLERIYSLFADFISTLHGVTPIVQQQFTLACVIDEVHSTSDIEGIHSTHRELKDILENGNHNSHFSSIIKKYYLLTAGNPPTFRTCEDIREFYDDFAHLDAIAGNPNNRLDGIIFRKEAVDIKTKTGKIIHRGLEPEEKIINALSEALAFLNSTAHPALIRIAVFHYLFAYIHPFYDGNGRTARFISSSGIAQYMHYLIALRLSVIIKRHKKDYYSILKETDSEINCGDLTPFIYTFLGFIEETIQDINRKLTHKMAQLERFKQKLSGALSDNIAWLMLQACTFYGRGLSMAELMALTGKSRNTIKKKLEAIPVRVICPQNTKKKFYKVDWRMLRN